MVINRCFPIVDCLRELKLRSCWLFFLTWFRLCKHFRSRLQNINSISNIIITFEHFIALRISIAVQWNDSETFFALSSGFLGFKYTKIFLENLYQPRKLLSYSATSALIPYKIGSYKLEYTAWLTTHFVSVEVNSWSRLISFYFT